MPALVGNKQAYLRFYEHRHSLKNLRINASHDLGHRATAYECKHSATRTSHARNVHNFSVQQCKLRSLTSMTQELSTRDVRTHSLARAGTACTPSSDAAWRDEPSRRRTHIRGSDATLGRCLGHDPEIVRHRSSQQNASPSTQRCEQQEG